MFQPKDFKDGQHQVVGNCNGIPMEERWKEETPIFRDIILNALPENAKVILDYGVGVGRIAKEVLKAKEDIKIIGVDNSREMLQQAKEYVNSDRFITKTPEEFNEKVDFAYTIYVLQHIPARDLDFAIQKIVDSTDRLLLVNSIARLAVSDSGGFINDGVSVLDKIAEYFTKFRYAIPIKTIIDNEVMRTMFWGKPVGMAGYLRHYALIMEGKVTKTVSGGVKIESDNQKKTVSEGAKIGLNNHKKTIRAVVPKYSNVERKIIFRQAQSPGDILVLSPAVRDLKLSYPNYQIDIRSPAQELWENNPHLTPLNENDPGVEIFDVVYGKEDVDYLTIHKSGWSGMHFSEAYYQELENLLGVKIRRTGMRPEIWLSDEERSWYNQVHCEFGWDGPFIVGNFGHKPDNELKQYHHYQEVVNSLNEYFKGRVKIVQIGEKTHVHPKLNKVLDLIGKTSLRQLIRLIYHAQMTIGGISLQMHLSAAFQQPAVIIAGAKEPIRWEMYPNHRYLAVNGCIKCGAYDGCWKGGPLKNCDGLIDTDKGKVPKCFEMIKPYQVVDAVKSYYEGGMLQIPSDEEYKKLLATQKELGFSD